MTQKIAGETGHIVIAADSHADGLVDLRPYLIRCNTVTMCGTRFRNVHHPELVEDSIAAVPLGALPHAEDIAYLASERARFITGETLNVDAGASTWGICRVAACLDVWRQTVERTVHGRALGRPRSRLSRVRHAVSGGRSPHRLLQPERRS